MSGFFISFEGGEGSGKTTQINALTQHLSQRGIKAMTTREPGGTPEGEAIRDLLVKSDGGNWTPSAELLLFYAARTMLVECIIKPALSEGKTIICDRFSDSTLAYQGYGHGLNPDMIKNLDETILGGFKPDLTILLDIPAEEGIKRSTRRLSEETAQSLRDEDRFEQMDIQFHERLRQGFLTIAKENPQRICVIDASQPLETVTAQVIAAAEKAISP